MEFQWTDEYVLEFTHWSLTCSPTFQGRMADLEQFKESKRPKQKLFTTEDGVNYFEGDLNPWYLVNSNFEIYACDLSSVFPNKEVTSKRFSSLECAKAYITQNKPIRISLTDLRIALSHQHPSLSILTQLEGVFEQKINP